jgi:hypothetical protein
LYQISVIAYDAKMFHKGTPKKAINKRISFSLYELIT